MVAVSAGWMVLNPLKSGVVVSLGASGALFGILGAQAVLNRLYASQLPGGYRFPAQSWWIILGVNFVALPLAVRQIDSAAHVGGLLSAKALAERAISKQGARNPNDPAIGDFTDTLATIDYRLGRLAEAIGLEQTLTYNPAVKGSRSQLARFLDLYWHTHGPLLIGQPAKPPELALKSLRGHWSLDVNIFDPQPAGAEIYALVRQAETMRGMIRIYIEPSQDAGQHATWTINGQELIDKNLDFNGLPPTVIVAEVDRTKCTHPEGGANFYPFEKRVAAYP